MDGGRITCVANAIVSILDAEKLSIFGATRLSFLNITKLPIFDESKIDRCSSLYSPAALSLFFALNLGPRNLGPIGEEDIFEPYDFALFQSRDLCGDPYLFQRSLCDDPSLFHRDLREDNLHGGPGGRVPPLMSHPKAKPQSSSETLAAANVGDAATGRFLRGNY